MKNQKMKKSYVLVLLLGLGLSVSAQCPQLIWSDEFDGNSLDLTKWEPMLGDGCSYGLCGWGNNELQYYKAENAVVGGGTLKIIAKAERYRQFDYSSARLRTKGLADFTFGRFEARIKLMAGQGFWPAFWMLSTNEPYGGWPQSGEIDIMELLGQEPAKIHGTIHYGQPYPNNASISSTYDLYDGTTFADDFHVFAIEWEPGVLRWYVDDVLYSTLNAADVAPENWPFDSNNPMHFLLNVAVGGNWPGPPDSSTPFPSQMEVDYVRVYDNGFHPSIAGDRLVPYQGTSISYSIENPGSATFSWSVPSGATITSGQGTSSITVDWGDTAGEVLCDVTTSCITKQYSIDVAMEPPYLKSFAFENFDEPGNVSLSSTSGTLSEISNPDPSGINLSALSGEYIRDSGSQYDLIAYSTSAITDASEYVNAGRKFYIDIHTNAPIGTNVLIQLESAAALPGNYPTGRHSRYSGTIVSNGEWSRVAFDYLDRPDAGVADNGVSTIILLFAPNSFTGDTYNFDNFDSYLADNGSGTSNTPPVASFSYSTNDLQLSLDGSGSSDSDGTISNWDWGFGDGNSGSGETVVHTYAASGDYSVTLTVTDNVGATNSSTQTVTVNAGGTGGAPVSVHVESVITGTQNAGQGKKRGLVTVAIYNDLEQATGGATVTGTFSGTFTETVSGTTDASGQVVLITSGLAQGGVTVNFCVDNVTHPSLAYDPSMNHPTCPTSNLMGNETSTATAVALGNSSKEYEEPNFYPNPVSGVFTLTKEVEHLSITTTTGQMIMQWDHPQRTLDINKLPQGSYIVRLTVGEKTITRFLVKN